MSAQVQVKFLTNDGQSVLVNVPFIKMPTVITAMQLIVNDDLILSFPFTMDEERYVRYRPGSDEDDIPPIVQHCNFRTKYEYISHVYQPTKCDECSRIQQQFNSIDQK